MQSERQNSLPIRSIVIGLAILLVVVVFFSFSSRFFYFLERVEEDEVGVQFASGRIKDVVGPGVYTDMGLFVDIKRVPSKAVAFQVTDEELITKRQTTDRPHRHGRHLPARRRAQRHHPGAVGQIQCPLHRRDGRPRAHRKPRQTGHEGLCR